MKRPLRRTCTGNTPTHVGKTRCPPSCPHAWEKHPHARGEDAMSTQLSIWRAETPPRTWGRLYPRVIDSELQGNTPTHVGKTRTASRLKPMTWKHPHARGEDQQLILQKQAGQETPPRTWGRPQGRASRTAVRRNTPTHVGKTLGIY